MSGQATAFVMYEQASLINRDLKRPDDEEHLRLHLRVDQISAFCLFGSLEKTRRVLIQLTNGFSFSVRFETNELAKAEIDRLAALMSQATAEG